MLRTAGDAVAGGMEFRASNGKVYTIRRVTVGDIAKIEGWLEGRAYESVRKMQGVVPNPVLVELAQNVANQVSSGKYAFGGEACNQAMNTIAGGVKLASIMCDISEDEAIQILTSDTAGFMSALNAVMGRSMPEVEGEPEGNPRGA